jgi:glycosyltransferase involved in cell wall biosynthesis
MNIFYVPSWFPSRNNPIYGTFIKEQIDLLGQQHPEWNLGISTWGQGDPDYMLWVKDHIFNVLKTGNAFRQPSQKRVNNNVTQYFTPCLTWTRKIGRGNINGLFQANEQNFKKFQGNVGHVHIIHAQATYPGALIAQFLSERYQIPYVVSIRMSPFPFPEFLNSQGALKPLIEIPLRNAHQLIATSHSLNQTLYHYKLSNVTVVNNPVDDEFFKPSPLKSEGLSILAIGRLEKQKGFDLLIQAVAELGDTFTGMLKIGGEGSEKKSLVRLAKQLGLTHKIVWLGELSRELVFQEMQDCSFYALSSRHETFGNVLLEAMACGKPVVATRCGGPTDIVTEDTGILCEPNNISDLSSAIYRMTQTYSEFASAGIRKHVELNFSKKKFAMEMERVYTNAIRSNA